MSLFKNKLEDNVCIATVEGWRMMYKLKRL